MFCVDREKIENARIVFCRAVRALKDSKALKTIWKYFLEFENTKGGNPSMTLEVLVQLVKQKLGTNQNNDGEAPSSKHSLSTLPSSVTTTLEQNPTKQTEIMQPQNSSEVTEPAPCTSETTNLNMSVDMDISSDTSPDRSPDIIRREIIPSDPPVWPFSTPWEVIAEQAKTLTKKVDQKSASTSTAPTTEHADPLVTIETIDSPSSSPIPSPPPLDLEEVLHSNSNFVTGKRSPTSQNNKNRKKHKRNNSSDLPLKPPRAPKDGITARQHDSNFRLNERLAQALINPSGESEDNGNSSLLLLEKIQQELLHNSKVQNQNKTVNDQRTPPAPNPTHTPPENRPPLVTREEIDRLMAPVQTSSNLPSVGRTILLKEAPVPQPTFMQTMIGQHFPQSNQHQYQQHYPAPPPQLLNIPPYQNHGRRSDVRYHQQHPQVPQHPPQAIDNFDWTGLLKDESILAIVRHLYELQVSTHQTNFDSYSKQELAEANNDKHRRQLQRTHKEEERRLLSENTRRLNSVRNSRDYANCKAENIDRISVRTAL